MKLCLLKIAVMAVNVATAELDKSQGRKNTCFFSNRCPSYIGLQIVYLKGDFFGPSYLFLNANRIRSL